MSGARKYSIQIVCHGGEENSSEAVTLVEGSIKDVDSILDLGLRHEEQIELLKKVQDQILKLQTPHIGSKLVKCPRCGGKLTKNGFKASEFNSVFTDHAVGVQHKRCRSCGWTHNPSIRSEFGTTMHPDLAKLHCEMGAAYTYRCAQDILDKMAFNPRRINNHERILQVITAVGGQISNTKSGEASVDTNPAPKLVVQVDGGHIKDKNPESRSFEAMAAVIYRPENILHKPDNCRGTLINKDCAASALSDNQAYIFESTLTAAQKQGLDKKTLLTALCDGASNCWSIVDYLSSYCRGVTRILDWFHIAMRFKNIVVPETQKNKFEKAKWHLWHGNVDYSLLRLSQVKESIKDEKQIKKLDKLMGYIETNRSNIVNYRLRQQKGLTFTSQLAESTVESLINRRCKGQQHMRWTRKGVHPLLQVRALVASNNWRINWLEKIMGAMTSPAY